MATSGTTNFTLNIVEAIEEAYERVGVEARGGYQFRTARRSIDLMMLDWQNRGLNLWTIDSGTIPLVSGTETYSLPADTVDLIETVFRPDTGSDRILRRLSVSDYSSLPNKSQTGVPNTAYVDRSTTPEVTFWPVPTGSTPGTFVYWRLRRIEDSGTTGSNTMDMPARFLPAFVAGLAYYLAQKVPEAFPRIPTLEAAYEKEWRNASEEDRSRVSFTIMPQLS